MLSKMQDLFEALFVELLQMPSCERLYMNAAGMLEEVVCRHAGRSGLPYVKK
jgi:hypothetical protein